MVIAKHHPLDLLLVLIQLSQYSQCCSPVLWSKSAITGYCNPWCTVSTLVHSGALDLSDVMHPAIKPQFIQVMRGLLARKQIATSQENGSTVLWVLVSLIPRPSKSLELRLSHAMVGKGCYRLFLSVNWSCLFLCEKCKIQGKTAEQAISTNRLRFRKNNHS